MAGEAPITPKHIDHAALPDAAKIPAKDQVAEATSARIKAQAARIRNASPGEAFQKSVKAERMMREGAGANAINGNIYAERDAGGNRIIKS